MGFPFRRVGTLGGEYEEIEMEYVYSTGICEQNGIQIRVFHLYSNVFHVFQWNTWSPSALEYDEVSVVGVIAPEGV